MNRIDRLFGVLLLLQARRTITAREIAAHYGVSERTIYRDVAALGELGVPVIGEAGAGYALMEGFFLPPLLLTADEAQAVFLAVKMLEASGNSSDALTTARDKLTAALPQRTRAQITPLLDAIGFYFQRRRFALHSPYLRDFQRAILERRVVWISYHGYRDAEPIPREIEPQRLIYNPDFETWYVSAYCRLRQGIRNFRFERIDDLRVLNARFIPKQVAPDPQPPKVEVRVRVRADVLRRVRERQHYGFVEEQPQPDGSTIMTYHIHTHDEMFRWLLGWGSAVEVLSPDSLRADLRDEARRLVNLLT